MTSHFFGNEQRSCAGLFSTAQARERRATRDQRRLWGGRWVFVCGDNTGAKEGCGESGRGEVCVGNQVRVSAWGNQNEEGQNSGLVGTEDLNCGVYPDS